MSEQSKTDAERPTLRRANLTDVGNGQRFALQHRAWARYCYPWHRWLLWTGTHWRQDPGDGPMRLAKATAQAIYQEIAGAPTKEEREQIARWATASESERRLQAMVTLAASEPGMTLLPSELDADGWLLNCQNGTIDLRTGMLRPHAREDLITRVIGVSYDPTAECPRWLKTLARILDGRQDLIRYFQKAIGYGCTGDTREQCLFVFWGTGSNGKSTILTTAATMLGEYALSTRPETLMVKRGDSIPNDVAQLKGRRFVIAVEADPGQRLAEGLVKQMTGSDIISARFMRAEFFQFEPTFKIFLATNHRPTIHGTDWAVWRRLRLVPFTVTIADDQQDRQLTEKLKAELPGILRWAVDGCLAWLQEGLGSPDAVRAATTQYRADMDVLGDFLLETCVMDPAGRVGARELYTAYEAWAHRSGDRPLKERTFSMKLTERGLTKKPTKTGKIWFGFRLRSPVDDRDPERVTDQPVTQFDPVTDPRAVQMPLNTDGSARVTDGDGSAQVNALARSHVGDPVNTRHQPVTEAEASPDDASDCFDPPATEAAHWP